MRSNLEMKGGIKRWALGYPASYLCLCGIQDHGYYVWLLKLPKDLGCILLQSHIRRKKEPSSKASVAYAV